MAKGHWRTWDVTHYDLEKKLNEIEAMDYTVFTLMPASSGLGSDRVRIVARKGL
jgi:hypothetical protein